MPRVLFITTEDLTGMSGSNISTVELVRAMVNSENIDLSLIAPAPNGSSPVPDSVSTYWLPVKPAGTIKWHLRHQPAMARALLSAIASEQPEHVIIRIGPSTVLPALVGVLPNTEYTVLIRGFVHRNLSIQRPVKAAMWANASVADQTVVAFEAITEMLQDLGVRRDITVIPNAVDPDKFTPTDGQPPKEIRDVSNDASFTIGFIGSMEDRHCVDSLIEAVASLPRSIEASLVLVGDGPQRPDLKTLVSEVGIQNSTVFTGLVPHEKIPRYIKSCDVLYGISDPDKPSNPIKIYEYLSCERPVITTQTPELIFVEQEDLGIAMESVEVQSIHDAIVDLYQKPLKKREMMGHHGREYVIRHHSWSSVVNQLVGEEA